MRGRLGWAFRMVRNAAACGGWVDAAGGGYMQTPNSEILSPPVGLVGVDALRLILWPDPSSRPSLRWVRELQARRAIPFIKVGVKVFFEPERVRAALRRFEQPVEA